MAMRPLPTPAFRDIKECNLYLTGSVHNQTVKEMRNYSFSVPTNVFCHCNPVEELTYEATKKDGSPLPGWLHFDPKMLRFNGVPPKGAVSTDIIVIATDRYGNQAFATFAAMVKKDRGGHNEILTDKPITNQSQKPGQHAQAYKLQNQYEMGGKPSLNEQLNIGRLTRMMESRALLNSLSQL